MKILPSDKYNSVLPTLDNVQFNTLFASSVLNEHVDGKVFVDDITFPTAVYILHASGMSLLYGELNNPHFKTNLKAYLLGSSNLRQSSESLQVVPGVLEKSIDQILDDSMCSYNQLGNPRFVKCKVAKDRRRNFKFNKNKFNKYITDINFEGYQIVRVDSPMFNMINGVAVPNQFWNSAENFKKFGIGLSIVEENMPVATAFSSSIYQNMLEIGVETVPKYRKKGLASIACAKLISYCLENNLEPIWSCRYGNHGSVNLAKKIGFELTVDIPYYELLH